jgi:tetratricopeptide (TPR) repeat protein
MVLVAFSVSVLSGQQATAAAKSQAKERVAKRACLSGDYLKGVSILAELFVDTNDPTYLFNQGRCYEQNVRYLEAAERFKEYLRKAPKLSDSEKADVDKHIADCEASAAKNQAQGHSATAEPSPPPTLAQPPAATAGANVTPSAATSSPPQDNPTPTNNAIGTSPGSTVPMVNPWQHTAKWVASGAAVALLAAGGIEHYRYYSKNNDYNDKHCTSATTTCNSLADAADNAKTWAMVGYGAAAVAAGVALVFWLTDSPRPAPASTTALAFTCAPALAGISCAGGF